MQTDDKQKQPNRVHIEGSNDSKLPDSTPPGGDAKENPISKNQNPRANENLNSPGQDNNPGNATDQVGSEITDGEDG